MDRKISILSATLVLFLTLLLAPQLGQLLSPEVETAAPPPIVETVAPIVGTVMPVATHCTVPLLPTRIHSPLDDMRIATPDRLLTTTPGPSPTPSIRPEDRARVTDLAPAIPERDKWAVIVQHPNGSRERFLIPSDRLRHFYCHFPPGAVLVTDGPPASMMGHQRPLVTPPTDIVEHPDITPMPWPTDFPPTVAPPVEATETPP